MNRAQPAIEMECEAQDDKPPSPSLVVAEPMTAVEDDVSARFADLAVLPQWNDWRWQMRNRLRSASHLQQFFGDFEPSIGLLRAAEKFPLAITPYYASLIRSLDETDPIFQMSVPQAQELIDPPFLKDDPLEEDRDTPVPGLVHRYSDRALVIATTTCAMYCRHCTRKRAAGVRETTLPPQRLARIVAYLNQHPEIHDVIVSGGDPFTLTDDALERVLQAVRSVPSVDIVRIGTRTPVTMPMRVTDGLVTMLRRYHPIWVNTHFNHPREFTSEAARALARLADAGIPMGNQSVLLRGINDDPETMEQLCRGLVRMRVRPYYLYQCDLVRGVEHFRTPLSRGIEIMEYLRGRVSGLAIPLFVVDSPYGGGKLPVLPNYVVSTSPTHTVLRNFEGMLVSYPEPCGDSATWSMPSATPLSSAAVRTPTAGPAGNVSPGVWELASGLAGKIQPANSARQKRRATKAAISVLESRSA